MNGGFSQENFQEQARKVAVGLHYAQTMALISDPRFLFMNHGYWDGVEPGWMAGRAQKSSWRLVDRCFEGVDVKGLKVLDVGCGRGGATIYLSEIGGAKEVIGIDYTQENVKHCQTHHQRAGREYRVGDADRFDLGEYDFDVVFNLESSHCYNDIPGFLGCVGKHLVENGLFVFSDVFGPGRSISKTAEQLAASGFEIVKQEEVTSGVAAAVEEFADIDAAFIKSIVPDPESDQIRSFLRSQTTRLRERYAQEGWRYLLWHCRKSSPS